MNTQPPTDHARLMPPIPDDLRTMHESAVALAGEHGRIQGYTLRKLIEELAALRHAHTAPSTITEEMARIVLAKYFGTSYSQTDMCVADMRAALIAALGVRYNYENAVEAHRQALAQLAIAKSLAFTGNSGPGAATWKERAHQLHAMTEEQVDAIDLLTAKLAEARKALLVVKNEGHWGIVLKAVDGALAATKETT